jgi:hypothetical protein
MDFIGGKMITIKMIPNVLSKEGRSTKQLPFVHNKSIRDYISQAGFDTDNCRIIVSGTEEKLLDHICMDQDEIIITPKIKDLFGFFATIGGGTGMFAFLWGVAQVAMIAYSVYAAIQGTRKPSFGSGSGMDEGSPTYGWDGIRTMQDVGVPIAVCYGEHKLGGNIANAYIRYDGDKSYLNVLLALCEGEIESINDIKFNDQPIENFDNVTTTERMGTNDQSIIPNFDVAHNFYDKNSTFEQSSAVTYTTVDDDVTTIDLHLLCPQGLYQVNSSGAVIDFSITYQVEYRAVGAGSWTDLGSTTITAKTRTTLRRVYRISGLTADQYEVRITKTSEDSSLDPIKESTFQWSQVDEIKEDSFAYPNTAVLGIEALATDQMSGTIPNITCVVKGRKISCPAVMNGAAEIDWEDYYWNTDDEEFQLISDNTSLTWDGSTYRTEWSRNPVWILKDLISNDRFGLGEFIDSTILNSDDLVESAKYCEELVPDGAGGYEKRFCLDVAIDSLTSAIDLIMQLTSSFNGFAFYSEGAVKIGIDKEEDYVQLFNMGRIKKNTFSQSWKSLKEVPNVLEAQILDAEKDYEQDTIAYIDDGSLAAGDPQRKKSVRLFVTKISQAVRILRYMAKAAKYQKRTYSFAVGIEAIACQVGDVCAIAHDVPQWSVGSGNVISATSNTITLDEEVTIESGKTYQIIIQHADDSFETQTISTILGVYSTLSISGSFDSTPAAYDRYAIYESTQSIKKVRILQMRRLENFEVEISAIDYDEDVYDDSDITLPENNYSTLDLTIPEVENLALTEIARESEDGRLVYGIDVWFEKPQESSYMRKFKRARIYLSEDGTNWHFRKEINGIHYLIDSDVILNKQYYVKVTTVAMDGSESSIDTAPQSTISMTGQSSQPDDVSSFVVNQNRDNIVFGWDKVSTAGIWFYEVRYGGSSWDSSQVLFRINGDHKIERRFIVGTGKKFFVKARSQSGLYSENATEGTLTVSFIPFENIVEEYSEATAWSGTKTDTVKSGDNLELDTGELSGTYDTPVRDLGYVSTITIKAEVIATISHDLQWDSDAGATFDSDPTLRFSGYEAPSNWSLQIKTSEDNITWSDWTDFQIGDYKCRYFQLRLNLSREDADVDLEVSTFDYYADLPDVFDKGDDSVTVAADGCDVTFNQEYHDADELRVRISITSGNAVYWKVTSKTTTGFTVTLYDAGGTPRTGDFEWESQGI